MPSLPPQHRRASVLYVEDNPVNAMLMAALMRHRPGLELVVASTGAQALRIAVEAQPALLLVDIRLPDCLGHALLALLRLLPGCEEAPAVAVTAESDFVLEGSGFDELWSKPLDLQGVLQRIDALMLVPEPAARVRPLARRGVSAAGGVYRHQTLPG